MRLSSIEEFVAQTRQRIRNADASLLRGRPRAGRLRDARARRPADGRASPTWPPATPRPGRGPADDPDRLAILQFTSGSTSDPKGVMLPDKVLCANLDAIAEAARLDPDDDVLVSWLPLYHDMGLVGLLTLPMSTGHRLVLGAPQDFTARPARWMEWLSTYGGTATAGPNFSYVLATRALNRSEPLDLSRLRIALNGAEPIDPDQVEAFVEAGARHGLRPGGRVPGLRHGRGRHRRHLPRAAVGHGHRLRRPPGAGDRALRGPGRARRRGQPPPGAAGPAGARPGDPHRRPRHRHPLRDREVGELEIRGTSVTPGYYRRPDANAELFHDGWLRTGDLAYTLDGQLVMCGRIKDVIIVGGRNVFPEDVERAVGRRSTGVRAGNVIAFGVDGDRGRESLVVVAESKADDLTPCAGWWPSGSRRGRRPRQGHRAGHAGHPAQDQLGQAAALAVQAPLPGRRLAPGGHASRRRLPDGRRGSGSWPAVRRGRR